ncbi:MAG: UvrD-helicase domain-containing protein [Proteobacteria bacterium]|nr:UvrD-helicase domain-containing protein [Pseudomonadota bacterium]
MSRAAEDPRAAASAAQRPAARPGDSVWVAASAGTGKTKVLTDRVLSLMLHGTAPARILCLTFTKAAAAEMSNRLADRLARWVTFTEEQLTEDLVDLLDAPPDSEMLARARELFARVLDAPGGMKILTIHAFCQSLLGRFPLEAGIAPHFQVLDERSAAELLQEAREEVLAGSEDGSQDGEDTAVAEVAVYAQEQSFQELMAELIRERARLRRLIANHRGVGGLRAAIFRALEVDEAESPDDVVAAACADVAFDHMGLRLVAEALAGGSAVEARPSRGHPVEKLAGRRGILGQSQPLIQRMQQADTTGRSATRPVARRSAGRSAGHKTGKLQNGLKQIESHDRPGLSPRHDALGVPEDQWHAQQFLVHGELMIPHVMLTEQLAVIRRQDHEGVFEPPPLLQGAQQLVEEFIEKYGWKHTSRPKMSKKSKSKKMKLKISKTPRTKITMKKPAPAKTVVTRTSVTTITSRKKMSKLKKAALAK